MRPLVDTRETWREEKAEPGYDPAEPILRSLAADGGGNVLHSEKGEVSCRCPATGTVRPMAFQGFEADRGTLKYRCPAAAYGMDCAGLDRCLRDAGSGAGDYGRVVRIDLAGRDRRTFTPTPWGSPSWKRGYARRAALERINSRLDGGFGFERHFVRGRAKIEDAPGPGGGRDDGAGAGRGPGGPPGADAFAGRPGAAARGLTAAVQPSAPNRPRRSRDPLARACGPARANGNSSHLDAANPVPSDSRTPVATSGAAPADRRLGFKPPIRRSRAQKPYSASASQVPQRPQR